METVIKKVETIREKCYEIGKEIEKTLGDMGYESEKIVGSGETFVDQFGTKVASLVSEVKKPDKINFQNIEA